ncbi:pseudouridine synthase [Synechococcus sp. CS-1329]|uniref:pseudouridine synthase n=1 Tax=Synechococcus sp. CS-1329 TaxID=2847975 RepID=UPI00223B3336|nr:pseudouridine synthase [Synechococcus sp. CS-1329]MCT0218248.1 pseudouridine synthase [Synechococcus sp. CS-1329]
MVVSELEPGARGAPTTLLLHKPYGVLSQFSPEPLSPWSTLAPLVPVPGVYAAGRLDADSEGLLLLTSDGALQHRLSDPRFGHWRRYWVQVEGSPSDAALQQLRDGVMVQGRCTLAAQAHFLADPGLAERVPPIRQRRSIPTAWLELRLREGRNRQVRRMTAAVGLPTLRLLRVAIDLMDGGPALSLEGLAPGQWRPLNGAEQERLARLLHGRGGRAGGGKSGRAGGGG